jgi:hypothetical protein
MRLVVILLAWVAVAGGSHGHAATDAGIVVFESNRTGNWELYRVNLDGSNEAALTNNGAENQWPSISPDGTRVAWTKSEGSRSGLVSAKIDGTDERLEAGGADIGTYLPDGRILFSKKTPDGRLALWTLAGTGQEPVEVFSPANVGLKGMNPVEFSSGQALNEFVFWSAKPRGTSLYRRDKGIEQHVHGGCMPRFMPDGVNFIWVREPGEFGIGRTAAGLQLATFYRVPRGMEFNHGYFPSLSADYGWLVYGACPHGQHDHSSANYQLFAHRIVDGVFSGEPVRLTRNDSTDRRPVVWTPSAGAFLAKLHAASNGDELFAAVAQIKVPGIEGPASAPAGGGSFEQRLVFDEHASDSLAQFKAVTGEAKIGKSGIRLEGGAELESTQTLEAAIRAIKSKREFTIAMDVWIPDREEKSAGIVLALKSANDAGNLAFLQQGARCRVAFKNSGKPLNLDEPQLDGKMPDAGFNFITLTYAGGALRLYINGKISDTGKVGKRPEEWMDDVRLVLGGRTGMWSSPWNGAIRSIQIVSRKLGERNIEDLYRQAKKERTPNPDISH